LALNDLIATHSSIHSTLIHSPSLTFTEFYRSSNWYTLPSKQSTWCCRCYVIKPASAISNATIFYSNNTNTSIVAIAHTSYSKSIVLLKANIYKDMSSKPNSDCLLYLFTFLHLITVRYTQSTVFRFNPTTSTTVSPSHWYLRAPPTPIV
jgi:hypothetical protein